MSQLIGVVHLPPLPGSPGFAGDLDHVVVTAATDARLLAEAGLDRLIVENFGDAPFFEVYADVMVKHAVPPPGLTIDSATVDTIERGLADAIIVSGDATGDEPNHEMLERAVAAAGDTSVLGREQRSPTLPVCWRWPTG